MRTLIALIAIAAVAIIGLMMRRGSTQAPRMPAPPDPGPDMDERVLDEMEEGFIDEDALGDSPVPLTVEGIAFVPRSHGVLLLPLLKEDETPDWLEKALDASAVPYSLLNQLYSLGTRLQGVGTPLGAGDFTAVRVVRGEGDTAPWRLETLGRDGDYGFHPFGARESAESACHLLESSGVVRRPVDEHGEIIPGSPEDFDEARLRYERTLSELATGDDPEPPREGQWVSDRR
jgi:hypothetical protein